MKIKITTVGDSPAIVLPKELLVRLRVGEGDVLHVTELADGLKLTAFDPKQMEVAEGVMQKNRDQLKKLADS